MTIKSFFSALGDNHFKVAVLALVATILTFVGVPEQKQSEVLGIIGALAVVIVAAKGYEQGKLNEGTVPDGSKPTAPPSQVNIITPPAETYAPPPTDHGSGGTGPGSIAGLLLIFGLCFGLTGCATSESFKVGMRSAGPLIADEGLRYTEGDGILSVAEAAAQAAQAQRLKTESAGTCDYVEVKSAWLDVKPWYLRYVRQDQRLTESERAIVLKTGGQIDALIAEEGKRRRLLFLPE